MVQELMIKILADLRHETVIVLRECEIPCAVFASWQMAYVSATPAQVAAWAGLSVAAGTHEVHNSRGEDLHRAEQFAQSILALLTPDQTAQTKCE
jgi:hypothetical protein